MIVIILNNFLKYYIQYHYLEMLSLKMVLHNVKFWKYIMYWYLRFVFFLVLVLFFLGSGNICFFFIKSFEFYF
jgi:hypothetical protein